MRLCAGGMTRAVSKTQVETRAPYKSCFYYDFHKRTEETVCFTRTCSQIPNKLGPTRIWTYGTTTTEYSFCAYVRHRLLAQHLCHCTSVTAPTRILHKAPTIKFPSWESARLRFQLPTSWVMYDPLWSKVQGTRVASKPELSRVP